jgi:hypothetical protein
VAPSLECPTCGNPASRNSVFCEYCGTILDSDEDARALVSARVCFDCGHQNDSGVVKCVCCGSPFVIVCPECKQHVPLGARRCTHCGLLVDAFHRREWDDKEARDKKKNRDTNAGLIVAAVVFLGMSMFFVVLGLKLPEGNVDRIGAPLGAGLFFLLFLVIIHGLFRTRWRTKT